MEAKLKMPETKIENDGLIRPIKSLARKKTARHPGWGGARPGAGRRPDGPHRLDSMIVIRMTSEQKACLKTLGGSSWLRKLMQTCIEAGVGGELDPAVIGREAARRHFLGEQPGLPAAEEADRPEKPAKAKSAKRKSSKKVSEKPEKSGK